MHHITATSVCRGWGIVKLAAVAVCLGLAAMPSSAQTTPEATSATVEAPKPHRSILSYMGISVSSFTPASRKTRDRFGGTWWSIGPKFSAPVRSLERKLEPGLSLMRRSHDGNKVTLIQTGCVYRQALVRRSGLLPYWGVKAHVTYASVDLPSEGGKTTRFTVGGAPFVGLAIGRHFAVEARYLAMPKVAGYDFSGAELEGIVRF